MPLTGHLTETDIRAIFKGLPLIDRVLDVVNVAEAARLRAKEPSDNYFCNFSQGVARRPWGSGMHCLTTGSETFDFGRRCVLTGADRLALMGLPSRVIVDRLAEDFAAKGGLGERDLERFAGQGMCSPCVGLVLLAVFLHPFADWFVQPQMPVKKRKA
jgi:hypothetical protein